MATTLYAIALHEFDAEGLHEWEPETVAMEMNEAFGIQMPEASFNKLMALISAVSSDAFYQRWTSFEIICAGMSDGDASGNDELLVAEMAWGVIEAKLNDETPGEFSHEVAAGVGALLSNEGFTSPPPALAFASMPEMYQGSDTPSDTGRQEYLSSEHVAVVREFVQDQAALLVRQLQMLPWSTEESLIEALTQIAGAAQ